MIRGIGDAYVSRATTNGGFWKEEAKELAERGQANYSKIIPHHATEKRRGITLAPKKNKKNKKRSEECVELWPERLTASANNKIIGIALRLA